MEKKDWIILIATFALLGVGTYFALSTLEGDNKSTLNYISIIGSAVTIFGFFFTIYQQFKIQSVSKQIKTNLEDYQKQVIRNLFNWQFEKVIRHCEKIDTLNEVNKIEKGCAFILTEIQESLKDCAKICKNSKVENSNELESNLKSLIRKISTEISSFTEHHKSSKYKYDTKSLVEIVKQINDFLKDNKTTYLNI
ncbi:hypothetical protein HUE46_10805 [Flavobacterium columnare]|uniref:hypothetical protein n=1 Tax=Flavobacterium columnare TaxID=996 RepID=UPI00178466E5|nr:hypothetical protein [Flavobacterium columnare]QOG90446.1 hypothetical protein HUE41_10805 [Flavobacterium columnare]QOG93102.1 hypothetical protein HUE42_10800 [Flavobacterium columnare]QOG95767.1 hypothetical protein HUE43_10800 [Flavobacterium columnare]QOG98427.1 hypothetical protein HUE44_10800 [Flavobacterium columnare]QOH01086.1 hypothetical protein HUE45_10800 [Flavobacterium columnare]